MKSSEQLQTLLRQIDHKGYPSYKDTRGIYDFGDWQLSIDHVQGDPYASPSKVSVRVSGRHAGFCPEYYDRTCRRIALQDYLLRQFGHQLEAVSFKARGSGKSGLMAVSRPGQEVLERTACSIDASCGDVTLRMEIGFPADGRSVNSRELIRILFDFLPECVRHSLFASALDSRQVKSAVDLADDQEYIRGQLSALDLVAFVADGAVLPRESGISGRPMRNAVPFRSPDSMKITLDLPHHGPLTGMAIRRGVTLIVGGGYHGKSTLLRALELGVYNHIAGDGREYVITDDSAVKIRAEDGRSIRHVDISMFIRDLPNGTSTTAFDTDDASGSTSQAANVVESMEAGCRVLLIDEDTSATNFMIRDELMQRVVHRDAEPIIPFIDRVRELYQEHSVSTVLVAGSSGAYFNKADCVIQMKEYEPLDITAMAKREAENYPSLSEELPRAADADMRRVVKPDQSLRGSDRVKIRILGSDSFSLNHETVDLRYVGQLTDKEQLAALAALLEYAQIHIFDGHRTLRQAVDLIWQEIERRGLGEICAKGYIPSDLAMPRKTEMFACINRYRRLEIADHSAR